MKKNARILAVMAAAATLGLGMASCDNGNGNKKNDDQPTYTPGTDTGSGGTAGTTTTSSTGTGSTETTTTSANRRTQPTMVDFSSIIAFDSQALHNIRAIKPSSTQKDYHEEGVRSLGAGAWTDHSDEVRVIGWIEGDTIYYSVDNDSARTSAGKIPICSFEFDFWEHQSYYSSVFPSLESIDLSGFDVSFCHAAGNGEGLIIRSLPDTVSSIDLSGWDTSNMTLLSPLICNCPGLRTIYASPSFVVPVVSDLMFSGCPSLVGGAGTSYAALQAAYRSDSINNVNPDSSTLARIDGGPSAPGYFTAK